MRRRRCNQCGKPTAPRINRCPDCGGEIRVTITEPGHGLIDYVIRHPNSSTQKVNDHE